MQQLLRGAFASMHKLQEAPASLPCHRGGTCSFSNLRCSKCTRPKPAAVTAAQLEAALPSADELAERDRQGRGGVVTDCFGAECLAAQ